MRSEAVIFPILRQVIKRERLSELLFKLDPWGNPFNAENLSDPFLVSDKIRADGTVVYKPLYQNWFISGYEEAKQVLSSSHATVSEQAETLLAIRPYSKLNHEGQNFLRNFLLLTDPPKHTRLRALVARAFTPRQVARLEDRMDAIINDLMVDLEVYGGDVVPGFTTPFPLHVIAELLGLPPERWSWAAEMSGMATQLLDPFRAFNLEDMNLKLSEFHAYVLELADERRANPTEDMLTALAKVSHEGDRLSEDELVAVFGLILFAGHETTAGLMGTSIVNLAAYPEQRKLLRDNPNLWPNAVEELLRFDSSVRSDPRVAASDIEVGGKTIKAGSNIVVMISNANRDLNRFERADELILDRKDPAPISFGHGIHYCIGANLARLEIKKGLQRLLSELGDYEVEQLEWKPSITLRGPSKLVLRAAG